MDYWTVKKFLTETMNQMGEAEKYRKDYEPYTPSLTNRLITECFDANNAIRESKGMEPLAEPPVVENMESVIPFEYDTMSNIMVYGLGYWLFFQDEEYTKANEMRAQYNANKERLVKALYADITSIV